MRDGWTGYYTHISREFSHHVYTFSFSAAKLSFPHISGTQVVWMFRQDPSLFAFPVVFVFSLKQRHVLARSNHELFSLTAGVPGILERLPYLLSPSVFFPRADGLRSLSRSLNLFAESAVTSKAAHSITPDALCKHRATAAKHRC